MNPDEDYEYTIDVWDDLAKGEILKNTWIDGVDDASDELESVNVRLATIEKRLSILVPDEKLLQKYEVLQDIYNQYKAAEALLDEPDSEKMT
jgi:uncharacterized protein (UPF0305 family)